MPDTRATPVVDPDLQQYRTELTGYCYRMLGSAFEADDAVQETMVRAWRAFDRFEGRSSVRSWLYRIATNVCFDLLNGKQRRARPVDMGPASTIDGPLAAPIGHEAWIEPIPDGRALPVTSDPAEMAVTRESIRLAFVAALQYLPARQRAVLILRDVLRMSAIETAELLDTSVASANSALQRARATLESRDLANHPMEPIDESQQALLARYVDAFERYDVDSFVALLHEDAVHSMPPYEMWLRGHDEIARFLLGPGIACRGSRLVPSAANGMPAFGQYRPSGPNGEHEPWALHVVEISDGRVAAITYFLDTERFFPMFGLPPSPSSVSSS
jgi:RNA polymerase sigma-70 factor (ECF subfamily)